MSKLLVTGGAGFIGVNFVRYWLERYPQDRIVVLDSLSYAGNRSSLDFAANNANFQFIHGDILDQPLVEQLLESHGIDTLVHFAAESHVDRSITGPDEFIQTNIVGTHSLLKAAKHVWLEANSPHRFHHVSTDEVYGSLGPAQPAFRETSAYGAQFAVRGQQSVVGSSGAGVCGNLGSAGHDQQLLKQLRPVPVPRKIDSADSDQRLPGQTTAGVRRWSQHTRLVVRGGSLPGY